MRITVAGIGYVGLVTGVCLAEMGFEVTCIDIQEKRIKMLQTGCSPIYEPELEQLLHKNLSNGRFFLQRILNMRIQMQILFFSTMELLTFLLVDLALKKMF